MTEPLRMNAYYYSFKPTGVKEIDRILSAVACAGKAFHSTEDWYQCGCCGVHDCDDKDCVDSWPPNRGRTPIDWIQNAANDAAELLRSDHLTKKFPKEVLQDLAWGDEPEGFELVSDKHAGTHRWSEDRWMVFRQGDTYYGVSYSKDLTEYQDEYLFQYEHPLQCEDDLVECQEVEKVEVTTIEWVVKGK